MTKPPCGNGIDDCLRRYIGCRAECEEWHEWLAIHAEEKEKFKQDLTKSDDAIKFLVEQDRRVRVDTVRRSARKRKL